MTGGDSQPQISFPGIGTGEDIKRNTGCNAISQGWGREKQCCKGSDQIAYGSGKTSIFS